MEDLFNFQEKYNNLLYRDLQQTDSMGISSNKKKVDSDDYRNKKSTIKDKSSHNNIAIFAATLF